MNILENILKDTRHPSRGLVQRITTEEKTIYNQELMDFSNIQKNTNALLATEADLRALPPKEQLQVSNLLKSMQRLVVAERGVATPVR